METQYLLKEVGLENATHLIDAVGDELASLESVFESLKQLDQEAALPVRRHVGERLTKLAQDVNAKDVVASTESDYFLASLEAQGDNILLQLFDWIRKAIRSFVQLFQSFWTWLTDSSDKLIKKCDELKKKVTGKRKDAITNKSILAAGWVENGKLILDQNALEKSCEWMGRLETLCNRDIEATEATAKAVGDMFTAFSSKETHGGSTVYNVSAKIAKLFEGGWLTQVDNKTYWKIAGNFELRNDMKKYQLVNGEMPGGYEVVAYASSSDSHALIGNSLQAMEINRSVMLTTSVTIREDRQTFDKDKSTFDQESLDRFLDQRGCVAVLDRTKFGLEKVNRLRRRRDSVNRATDYLIDQTRAFSRASTAPAGVASILRRQASMFLRVGGKITRIETARAIQVAKAILSLVSHYAEGRPETLSEREGRLLLT